MREDRYWAKFHIAGKEYEFTGDDAFDIINKLCDEYDLRDVIDHANIGDSKDDAVIASMLYDWMFIDFEYPGDMHRFDRFDFDFTFGKYYCIEWGEIEH